MRSMDEFKNVMVTTLAFDASLVKFSQRRDQLLLKY